MAFWSRMQYADRVRLVAHTREVLDTISDVALEVTRAESAQQSFILVGELRRIRDGTTSRPHPARLEPS